MPVVASAPETGVAAGLAGAGAAAAAGEVGVALPLTVGAAVAAGAAELVATGVMVGVGVGVTVGVGVGVGAIPAGGMVRCVEASKMSARFFQLPIDSTFACFQLEADARRGRVCGGQEEKLLLVVHLTFARG